MAYVMQDKTRGYIKSEVVVYDTSMITEDLGFSELDVERVNRLSFGESCNEDSMVQASVFTKLDASDYRHFEMAVNAMLAASQTKTLDLGDFFVTKNKKDGQLWTYAIEDDQVIRAMKAQTHIGNNPELFFARLLNAKEVEPNSAIMKELAGIIDPIIANSIHYDMLNNCLVINGLSVENLFVSNQDYNGDPESIGFAKMPVETSLETSSSAIRYFLKGKDAVEVDITNRGKYFRILISNDKETVEIINPIMYLMRRWYKSN
jgi:hypothetical protein